MPRSNHPRSRRQSGGGEDDLDMSRTLIGNRHQESKRDGLWNVQPLAAAGSTKFYTCPECQLEIAPGVAHTVTWRADGLMGEDADLAGRRHWHAHCWKIHR